MAMASEPSDEPAPNALLHSRGWDIDREPRQGRRERASPPIAARWSLVLGIDVSAAQVALCLIDLNFARLTRDPSHLDVIVHVAGYAASLREVTHA